MENLQNNQSEIQKQHIRFFLKNPPHLLQNFHHDDVLAFLELGLEERFSKGDIILGEGEYVNSAYLIADGKVSVWKDNIELATLGKSSFLGETFLFSKNNRMAKIICESDGILLKYERYTVLNYFRKRPEKLFNIFTKNIIEIQQKKISNMNIQLYNLKKRILNK